MSKSKSRPKTLCIKCGNLFANSGYVRHFKACSKKSGKISRVKEEWKQPNGKYKCPNCHRDFKKRGICAHIWRMHTEEGQKFNPNRGYVKGTRKSWDKGLTKENSSSVRKRAQNLKKGYVNGKYKPSFKGKKHSQETKDSISKSRIEYLEEHPDKVPYRLNHSSKMSYPEKTFMQALKENNVIGWVYKYQAGIYEYDFAFPDFKLDVEIDGSTHLQEKVVKIDQRRDAWSRSQGWEVLRFTAKEVKANMQGAIDKLKNILREISISRLNEGT